MNKVIRTTWIILLLTVASGMARAQQGLQIASVFQKYGKQKGVTMVELSNEMLETYQMTLYKSLVFKDVEEAHAHPFSTVWMLTKRRQRK